MAQVRSSKYRHVYGDPNRKERCYDNIRLTKNAFDSNLVKSNGKYLSLNWDASGGGSFAVVPLAEAGKLPDRFPLFDGHKGAVLDTDWNPFDDEMVVSASDDGSIGVWRVPEGFTVHEEYGSLDDCKDITPVKFIEGHGKKVGHVGFNPVAENILASSSLDNTIKIWDIESGDALFTLQHPAFVTSFSWNYDGTKLVTVAKDKKIRVWDVRAEKVLSEGKGHAGAKGSRVIWLGDNDRVLSTGFSLFSDREMALWDTSDIEKGPIGGFRGLDPSSGIVIPHYDPMTSVVYLGGRGDGKIVYYEYADDTLYDLFAYNSTSPQRGLGWVPLRSLDPKEHEVARVYKVHDTIIEPIPFRVPLKSEGFLDNVYTYADAGVPALKAAEWKSGKTARPLVKDWKSIFEGKDAEIITAPVTPKDKAASAPAKAASPKATPAKAKDSEPKKADSKSSSEPKSPTESKSQPEPKSQPVSKSAPAEAKSSEKEKASEAEISALKKAEKQDSYDVLQSDEVKSFLEKNSEKEDSSASKKDEEDDSAWDNEPAELVEEPAKKASEKAEAKKEEVKTEKPKKESKKEEPKKEEPKKEEAKKEEPKKEAPETSSKSNGSKTTEAPAPSTESDSASVVKSLRASSEDLSTAAAAAAAPLANSASKLDELLIKIEAFNVKVDDLAKRLETIESKGN